MELIVALFFLLFLVGVFAHLYPSLFDLLPDYRKGRADVSHLNREEIRIIDESRMKGSEKSSERLRLEILLFNHPHMEQELIGDLSDLDESEVEKELKRLSAMVRDKEHATQRIAANGTLRPRSTTLPQSEKKDLNLKIN